MNIGIRLHDTTAGTLEERLAAAAKQGFSCAHIALSKVLSDFRMKDAEALLTEELADRINLALARNSLSCAVLGCYLSLADPDEERYRQTLGIYKAHLQFAGKIHAGVVGTETPAAPGAVFPDAPPESEEAYRLFVDRARPAVRYAEEANAILAVEPVHSHIISTPERAERLLNDLDSDHVQIILDAVNLISPEKAEKAEEVISDAIRRLGNRVRVLHMKDFTVKDGKISSLACGNGSMKYGQLLAFAKEKNLPMTLEDTRPDNAEKARLFLEEYSLP